MAPLFFSLYLDQPTFNKMYHNKNTPWKGTVSTGEWMGIRAKLAGTDKIQACSSASLAFIVMLVLWRNLQG